MRKFALIVCGLVMISAAPGIAYAQPNQNASAQLNQNSNARNSNVSSPSPLTSENAGRNLDPFTTQTNYMSLPGYIWYMTHQHAGR